MASFSGKVTTSVKIAPCSLPRSAFPPFCTTLFYSTLFYSALLYVSLLCLSLFLPLNLSLVEAAPAEATPLRAPGSIRFLAYRTDGSLLAAALSRKILLWDLKHNHLLSSFSAKSCETGQIQFSPNGRFLAPARRDCSATAVAAFSLRLWDGRRAYNSISLTTTSRLAAVAFDPQSQFLATLTVDGLIDLFELSSRKKIGRWRLPLAFPRRSLAHLPYGFNAQLNLIAVQDWRDYYMELYSFIVKKKKQKYSAALRLQHKTEYPFGVRQRLFAFSPDGRFYFDGLRLRSVKDGKIQTAFSYNSPGSPQKALFSPDGRLLALLLHHRQQENRPYNYKSYIDIYHSFQGNHLFTLVMSQRIDAFAFHPDGKTLSLGGVDGRIYFLDLEAKTARSIEGRHIVKVIGKK